MTTDNGHLITSCDPSQDQLELLDRIPSHHPSVSYPACSYDWRSFKHHDCFYGRLRLSIKANYWKII